MITARSLLLAAGAAAVCAVSARAQTTVQWLNAASGNWSDGLNWSGGVAPDNSGPMTFRAEISATGAAYTVTLDIDPTISAFLLDSIDATLDGQTSFGLEVLDDMTLTDARVERLSTLQSRGNLIFDSVICNDLCDTPLVHTGTTGAWRGGNIRLLGSSSFTVETGGAIDFETGGAMTLDPTAALTNRGTLTKTDASVTDLDGGAFLNEGVVRVEAGTVRTLNGALDINGNANTLGDGRWEILDTASLDLDGQQILTNAASVRIEGSGSFAALTGFLETNAAAGVLELATGGVVTTAGNLTNDGRVAIEAGTTLRVAPGSTLLSSSGGALGGGRYEIAGALQYDGAAIDTIDAQLVISGAGDIVDDVGATALGGALTVAPTGELDVRGGRTFTTGGDLRVQTTGTLRVEAGSEVAVPEGFEFTSFNAGTFTEGVYEIDGTLRFPDAAITTIDSDITIRDVGQIINTNGDDAFTPLDTINPGGALSVEAGRALATANDLALNGALAIVDPATVVTVGGDLNHAGLLTLGGGTLNVNGQFNVNGGAVVGSGVINGNMVAGGMIGPGFSPGALTVSGRVEVTETTRLLFEIGGLAPGAEHDLLTVGGALDLGGDRMDVLEVSLIDGYIPRRGDVFDLIFFGSLDGEIGASMLPSVPGLTFELRRLSDRVRLVVAPAPSGLLVLAPAALAWGRRPGRLRRPVLSMGVL